MSAIRIAVALMRDNEGRVLLVRKQGTHAFMQPGGKIENGEEATVALIRELAEELDLKVEPSALLYKGQAVAPAANEPGFVVEAEVFELDFQGPINVQAELAEAVWLNPAEHADFELAPLTRDHILPMAMQP